MFAITKKQLSRLYGTVCERVNLAVFAAGSDDDSADSSSSDSATVAQEELWLSSKCTLAERKFFTFVNLL